MLPLPCMLVCIFVLRKSHARPRVQQAPGLPCALYFDEGPNEDAKLGRQRAARMPHHIQLSSPRRRGSSIPETVMIEPMGCSLLDPRLRGDDGGARIANFPSLRAKRNNSSSTNGGMVATLRYPGATETQLTSPAASVFHAAPPAGGLPSSPASRHPSGPSPRPRPRDR